MSTTVRLGYSMASDRSYTRISAVVGRRGASVIVPATKTHDDARDALAEGLHALAEEVRRMPDVPPWG